jgi:hypothetical protein
VSLISSYSHVCMTQVLSYMSQSSAVVAVGTWVSRACGRRRPASSWVQEYH